VQAPPGVHPASPRAVTNSPTRPLSSRLRRARLGDNSARRRTPLALALAVALDGRRPRPPDEAADARVVAVEADAGRAPAAIPSALHALRNLIYKYR
jgi:hypothetical protein